MSDHTDTPGREPLTDRDLAIATLVGRYIERRESAQAPCVHDLFALRRPAQRPARLRR
jgi:hypothetical protein